MWITLSASEWQARQAAHAARFRPTLDLHLSRRSRGQSHPVYDFMFDYYPFRMKHLLRWTPGADVVLEGAVESDLEWEGSFAEVGEGIGLASSSFPIRRKQFLSWAAQYLRAVSERQPMFSCFGLHEWAMVYRSEEVRHEKVPLRLSPDDIAEVVHASGLRCTHFDAFRFFTPAAVPLNRHELTRDNVMAFDQPGCLHANMDIYRFAFKIAPYVSSELLGDAFELACENRELDMRASPYDLSAYGFEAVMIETKSGREAYVQRQREIYEKSNPLRIRLAGVYERLLVASAEDLKSGC